MASVSVVTSNAFPEMAASQHIERLSPVQMIKSASAKILKKCNFDYVRDGIDPDSKLPEKKYQLLL